MIIEKKTHVHVLKKEEREKERDIFFFTSALKLMIQ